MIFAALTIACASANAQSMLERLGQRAKEAVGEKVEGAVNAGLGKIMGGKQGQTQSQTSNNNGSNDDFIYTARGAFNKGDDPYKALCGCVE